VLWWILSSESGSFNSTDDSSESCGSGCSGSNDRLFSDHLVESLIGLSVGLASVLMFVRWHN